jgi:DNA-directed RNA polymerase specialized sigma24 family protein
MSRRDRLVEPDPRIAQILEFLNGNGEEMYSAKARKIATTRLTRSGLPADPHSVDELILDTHVAITRTFESTPSSAPLDSAEAYFRTALANRLKDLFRSRDRRVKEVPPGGIADDPEWRDAIAHRLEGTGNEGIVIEDDADSTLIDRFRTLVDHHGRVSRDHVTISGVLTWLTLEIDDLVPYDDAPSPAAGVAENARLGWPALWFAKRDASLFASGASRATQRRRQRAMGKISDFRAFIVHQMQMETAT